MLLVTDVERKILRELDTNVLSVMILIFVKHAKQMFNMTTLS